MEKLRADAMRNRRQILDAAAQAFADEGLDVPMERVAARAGVGVGTLYRRFPDRLTLLLAVVKETLEALLEAAEVAVREEPTAWDALVRAMSDGQALQLTIRPDRPAPPEVASAVRTDPELRRLRRRLSGILDGLVVAAQDEGSMRRDVGTGDVAQLFAMVKYRRNLSPSAEERAPARAIAIVLDGLRASSPSALPGEPLDIGDVAPNTGQGR